MIEVKPLEELTGLTGNFGVKDKALRDGKIRVLLRGALWFLTFFIKEGLTGLLSLWGIRFGLGLRWGRTRL